MDVQKTTTLRSGAVAPLLPLEPVPVLKLGRCPYCKILNSPQAARCQVSACGGEFRRE